MGWSAEITFHEATFLSTTAVELHQVVKRFSGQSVVDEVDLSVPTGSIYGFIGPNGSGKTTTMRLILRIYQPDSGHVEVLGSRDVTTSDPRVGYLPEERGLYRRMTVRQILRYFAALKGVRRPGPLIDDYLERMEASSWQKKRIEQLSKGMAQKIQFIVALIANPELVILDEPFSGLDPVNLDLIRNIVLELRNRGTTVIFSTHDMSQAQQMCDRVFMIYRGKKVLDGTIDSIRQSYGKCMIRAKLADGASIPEGLPGVLDQTTEQGFFDLRLNSDSERQNLLNQLTQIGDVEHFETVRPTLHDIFVQIAKPKSSEIEPAEVIQ
ncbi:MAG: ATP-binding cassette domain-containing protein [Planctomycetaceae bacterium]|nr:ATP-binding cassette domain-containing protein [Planctomycetaceae bacterium]